MMPHMRREPLGSPSPRAIEDVGRMVLEGRRVRDSLPVEEAARRAMRRGGPSYEELVEKIRAQRAHWPAAPAA